MSKAPYQRSELIELLDLVGELMQAGVDRITAWRRIHAAARDCRLECVYVEIRDGRPPEILGQADLDPGYCVTEIANQTFVDFCKYDPDWDPRYYTIASVHEVFPHLPAFGGAPPPPEPLLPSANNPNSKPLPPLPKAREAEVIKYLKTQRPVSEGEALALIVEKFGSRITRARLRAWREERPRRPPGRPPRQEKSS